MVSEDTKFVTLYEHYVDSFTNVKESIKLRDKLMFFILFLLALIIVYTFWPNNIVNTVTEVAMQKYGATVHMSASFLGSVIWFGLLSVLIRYTQTIVYIERQYSYIHKLEDDLQEKYESKVIFSREGKSYLENYPAFSNWVCFLYTMIFPVIVILIVSAIIISEWVLKSELALLPLLLNTSIAICILISTILYIVFMYKQNH